ncbi:citramalyl-CoA lyase, mitochondrial-like [Anneissia japonica]|uniref:citramalyl-CoA lyase, mitochondrial-like n=1 Tax=Anneissia japonica TaxID=1529436 RepID=UPI00142594BE|nr:citramalyl-CoA lyase, mitochondrial-like [Anneissia japonica]
MFVNTSFSFIKRIANIIGKNYNNSGLLPCQKWTNFCTSSCLNSSIGDEYLGSSSRQSGFTPRRAVLYVPASEQNKLEKLKGLAVDCAVMDCEDGVSINRKDVARENIRMALDSLSAPGVTDLAVRINAMDSGIAADDLAVIYKASNLPKTVMLPKVNSKGDLHLFSEMFVDILKTRQCPDYKAKLVIFVESAIGLLNLRDILAEGIELSKTVPFHLEGVVFGSDDFCADIGASRTEDAKELLYARQKVVLTAKAFELQAVDLVHINFRDLESLEKQSLEGAGMGFTGKQVIHPSQVYIVQKAFSPSADKVEWAQELIKAFEDHERLGKGAMTFRGSMIDMPLVLQARNILRLVNMSDDATQR